MGGVSYFFLILSRFQLFFGSVPREIQITSSKGENLGTFYCLAELIASVTDQTGVFFPLLGKWRPEANLFFFFPHLLGTLLSTMIHHQPSAFSPRKGSI